MNYSIIFKDSSKPLKERQLAFLNDCITHYTSENRGIKVGTKNICSYSGGCQIGRYLPKKLCKQLDKESVTVSYIIYELPNWMQKLGGSFLEATQDLHDSKNNWDKKGLTERGKDKVKIIKENFDLF